MDSSLPGWDTALFVSKVNQYYFTGTMQNALLVITRERKIYYFVRKSFERAQAESPLSGIFPMRSYRDAAAVIGSALGNTYVEADVIPLAYITRLEKNFEITQLGALDNIIKYQRAVKSPYELFYMQESGKRGAKIVTEIAPALLKEGMSEADYHSALFTQMVKHGHTGVTRFNAFQIELFMAQTTFGNSSLNPLDFDGPSGGLGGAFAPGTPSLEKILKKGDLVLTDISLCYNGYNSDTTQICSFGAKPAPDILRLQQECADIRDRVADSLRPGEIPSKIYTKVLDNLTPDIRKNFMGYGARRSAFVGHGIGLTVDEYPVIAKGFDIPLEENMTFAVEPKVGIEGAGLIGVEDVYVVTPHGGRCLTAGNSEIIVI